MSAPTRRARSRPSRTSARLKALDRQPPSTRQTPTERNDQAAANRQLVGDMNEAAGKTASTRSANAPAETTKSIIVQISHKRNNSGPIEGDRPAKGPKLNESSAAQGRRIVTGSLPKVKKKINPPLPPIPQVRVDLWAPGADGNERPKKRRVLSRKQNPDPSPLKNQGVVSLNGADVNLEDDASDAEAPRPISHTTHRRGPPRKSDEKSGQQHSRPGPQEGSSDERNKPESDVPMEAPISPVPSKQQQSGQDGDAAERLTSGIEAEIGVHACEDSWTTMFVAADDIRLDNENRGFESEVGRSTGQALRLALTLWKQAERSLDDAMDAIDHIMSKLRNIIPSGDSMENASRGRDLYRKLIPGLVRLLRTLLKAIRPTENMALEEVEPVIRTLEYTEEAVNKAMKWTPRPASLQGQEILGRTRNDIARSIKDIKRKYAAHYNLLSAKEQAAQARLREDQRVQAAQRREREYKEDLARRLKAIRDHNRRQLQTTLQRSQLPQSGEPSARRQARSIQNHGIADIDDWEDADLPNSPQNPEMRRRQPHSSRIDVEERQGGANPWQLVEVKALLKGLERFTGPDRFHDILDEYGDDQLAARDHDELRAQAVSILRAMSQHKSQLPTWLTSVVAAR